MALSFRPQDYLGISVGAASGSLIFGALPFVVGSAIATFGNPASAGMAASAELVAMGLSSTLISRNLHHLSGRSTAILCTFALVLAQLASGYAIFHQSWFGFLAARSLAGLAEGGVYTICNALAAKANRPDRAFTMIAFAQTILTALFFTSLVMVNSVYDSLVTFKVFAAFAVVGLVLAPLVPGFSTTNDGEDAAAQEQGKMTPVVRQMLCGFAVFSIALYMLFPYIENIGVNAGFTHSQIATILAFSSISALFGPVIVALIGSRFGRAVPICLGLLVQMVTALVIVNATRLEIWAAGDLISVAMLYVLTPWMFGLAADLDPTGRAAAAASGIMAITAAIGPMISSAVLTYAGSYTVLGWVNVATYAIMAAIVWGPMRRSDTQRIATMGLSETTA